MRVSAAGRAGLGVGAEEPFLALCALVSSARTSIDWHEAAMAARWLAELRRRKVHRALLAYTAACWLLAQILQFLADAYGWPIR